MFMYLSIPNLPRQSNQLSSDFADILEIDQSSLPEFYKKLVRLLISCLAGRQKGNRKRNCDS